ncbi:MAG: T9SS type A sorting domain-containing protein [Saprospiraceae bacterium]|nr:T9SS type A sorting domain-containing protein [Saprospiraceae bacterium]
MLNIKLKCFAVLMLSFNLAVLNAQEAIVSTGGNSTGIGGSVSYTIGQIVYATDTGLTGSVAQGVQQPFEISVVGGLENTLGITLQCSVYPNPTADFLNLIIDNYNFKNLSYQIFDLHGKLLEKKKLIDSETVISTANLPSGTYFLKVVSDNKEVKIFKIIKNH